jgi:hypothetical protein
VDIKIAYPPDGGTAADPVRVPRHFIAFGTKKAAEIPVGVMMSIDDGTHKADGKVVIGGTSILPYYKKKVDKTLVEDPTKWAIYFRMSAHHKRRFSLLVFDGALFPPVGMVGPVSITVVRRDYLATEKRPGAKKGDKEGKNVDKDAKKVARPVGILVNPPSGTHMFADLFIASGDLPPGDYDIDTGTMLVDFRDHTTKVCDPDWSWSDGSSFWAAFFPPIDKTTYQAVDVQVVFKPSGDEDGSTGIVLD